MRRIDRYLLSEMLIPALVGITLLLLLLLGNVLYMLLMQLYGGASLRDLGLILAYSLPELLLTAIPGALLLGTALSLNRLERDRELLAMRMAGMRLKRAIVPYLLLGIVSAVGMFLLQDTLVPSAAHKAAIAERKLIMDSPGALVQQDVFFKMDNYVFYVRKIDPKSQVMEQVLIYKIETNAITLYNIPRAVNQQGHLIFQNDPITKQAPICYVFDLTGNYLYSIVPESGVIDLKQDVWHFLNDQPSRPEELTFAQLLHLLKGMRGMGSISGYTLPLTPPELTFFLHRKLAVSLSTLVAILIAIPLSVHFGRSGGYIGLLLSVVVAFFFTIAQQWASVLVVKNLLDPVIAAGRRTRCSASLG